jgi:hypothetical protein
VSEYYTRLTAQVSVIKVDQDENGEGQAEIVEGFRESGCIPINDPQAADSLLCYEFDGLLDTLANEIHLRGFGNEKESPFSSNPDFEESTEGWQTFAPEEAQNSFGLADIQDLKAALDDIDPDSVLGKLIVETLPGYVLQALQREDAHEWLRVNFNAQQ